MNMLCNGINKLLLFPLFLLCFASSSVSAFFSSTTTKSIQGRAPWMSFDGGKAEAKNLNELLSFTVPDGQGGITTITPDDSTTAIKVPKGSTFADIKTKLLANDSDHDLKALYQNGTITVKDADGDSFHDTDAVSGTFKATLRDKYNAVITNLNEQLNICSSPYKLTIEANNVQIESQYGNPRKNSYGSDEQTYILEAEDKGPILCYVQPTLELGEDRFAGPASMWTPKKGFLVQSTTNPSLNFPTTGFDGAFFDLDIGGLEIGLKDNWPAAQLDSDGKATAMRVEVKPVVGNKVRVTLRGPNERDTKAEDKLFAPTTVKISSPNGEINYSFKIQRWFVPVQELKDYSKAVDFCSSYSRGLTGVSYIIPSLLAYTNAVNNHYTRSIGVEAADYNGVGGIFSEWGWTTVEYYPDSGWRDSRGYWTNKMATQLHRNYIGPRDGAVWQLYPSTPTGAACHSK